MPGMDMSAALLNPYTLSKFTVNRRSETVNNFGESVQTVTPFTPVYGVVFPESDNNLMRKPDGEIASKAIGIVCKFALRNESAGFQPDIVVWNNNQYVVMYLLDYSQYGPGFLRATAHMMDFIPTAPVTE
jgi:hypothetical protein